MRVAVIGAGVSGITAAKCLLDERIEPVVFEQGLELGGVWTFDEALPDGGGPAYRSLHTNTLKQITAFSDFPFPGALPDYPARADVLSYLQAYARHFGVYPTIRFNTSVAAVTPQDGARWLVHTTDESIGELFDAVVVCSGVFREPLLPQFKGRDSFTGTLIHSRAYTVPDPFVGQTVVVVGTGSSGSDIAVEVSKVAKGVYLSARGTVWETALKPRSATQVQNEARREALRRAGARLVRYLTLPWQVRRATTGRQQPDAYFAPSTPQVLKPPVLEQIAAGLVQPKPAIKELNGNTVVFSDGIRIEADTIICATGYGLSFPFLDAAVAPVGTASLPLYRLIFPSDHPTLAFLGVFRLTGPVLPVAEMQARWVARILCGAVTLPAPSTRRAAIAARVAWIAHTGADPFRLQFEPYLDRLAAEIGSLPRVWRHLSLLRELLLGPPVAARYRLDGPGRWTGAEQAIRAAQPRQAPTTQLSTSETLANQASK